MIYRYSYISKIGKEFEGVFEGTRKQLLDYVHKKQWVLISLRVDFLLYLKSLVNSKKVKAKNLPAFFEEFRDMLTTGLPINDIFEALKETNDDKILVTAMYKIQDFIKSGTSLSEAFNKSGVFDGFVISSIETGEKAGRLSEVMDNLSTYYRNSSNLNDKLMSQLSYPLFVGFILFAVVTFITFYAVPRMGELLPAKSSQNFFTSALCGLSSGLRQFWFLPAALIVFMIYLILTFRKSNPDKFSRYFYNFPGIGRIAKEKDLAYYFLNLAALNKSGVSLIESLSILHSSNKSYISSVLMDCRKYVISGSSFWIALKKFNFFPTYVFYTVRKGEETGKLSDYYTKIYLFYLNRVNTSLNRLTAVIQPILLFSLAGVLIFIVLAFLMPIYSNLSTLTDVNSIKP